MPSCCSLGRLRLVTRPRWTGSSPTENTIGIVAVTALAAEPACFATGRSDHRNLAMDQIGQEHRQAIVEALQPTDPTRYIPAFEAAGFIEAIAERGYVARGGIGRPGTDKPDHWQRRLLRPSRERPRDRSTAKCNLKIPPCDVACHLTPRQWDRESRKRAAAALSRSARLNRGKGTASIDLEKGIVIRAFSTSADLLGGTEFLTSIDDYARTFVRAREAGFHGVQLYLEIDGGVLNLKSTEGTLRDIARAARNEGVGAPEPGDRSASILADVRRCPATIRRSAHCDESADIARSLGCRGALVIPGYVGKMWDPATDQVCYADAYRRTVEGLTKLAMTAESLGVSMDVEPIWNMFLLSPLEIRDLVDEVGSGMCGVLLDTGNVTAWIRRAVAAHSGSTRTGDSHEGLPAPGGYHSRIRSASRRRCKLAGTGFRRARNALQRLLDRGAVSLSPSQRRYSEPHFRRHGSDSRRGSARRLDWYRN